MPTIRSRSAANLPAVPSSIGHRSLSSWAGIRVHHTGGAFSSWRAVHDWQTSGRPAGDRLAYIGYSFGVSSGDLWTLRGFDHHPAHDFMNTHIGVVFGGSFETGLPRDRDLDALVWFVHEAERRCGKKLPISTHREVGQTTCPGGRLHQWIKQELPGRLAGEEDDVELTDKIKVPEWVLDAYPGTGGGDKAATVATYLASGYGHSRIGKDRITKYGKEILAGQAAILAAVTGQDQTAAIRAELNRHRAELVAELGEDLAAAVSAELAESVADLPAETVEAAVGRALARTRLAVDSES